MKVFKLFPLAALALLAAAPAGWATPSGAPLSEIQPKQLSLGVYIDHSGQPLYDVASPSVLNTTGLSVEYGVINFVNVGLFAGAAEFDVDIPPHGSDTNRVFNSNFSPYGGLSAKVASPRFLTGTSRIVGFGQAAYINTEDDAGNVREGLVYNTGLTWQTDWRERMNFVIGGEFYAIDGKQQTALGGAKKPFGVNAPEVTDYFRGLVGVEYFFKGPNRPFISLLFRPTGALGYNDNLGLEGGSISLTFGAITSFGKQSEQAHDDDSHVLGD